MRSNIPLSHLIVASFPLYPKMCSELKIFHLIVHGTAVVLQKDTPELFLLLASLHSYITSYLSLFYFLWVY